MTLRRDSERFYSGLPIICRKTSIKDKDLRFIGKIFGRCQRDLKVVADPPNRHTLLYEIFKDKIFVGASKTTKSTKHLSSKVRYVRTYLMPIKYKISIYTYCTIH